MFLDVSDLLPLRGQLYFLCPSAREIGVSNQKQNLKACLGQRIESTLRIMCVKVGTLEFHPFIFSSFLQTRTKLNPVPTEVSNEV